MMLSTRAAAFMALLIGSARAQSTIVSVYGQQTCTTVLIFSNSAGSLNVPFRSTGDCVFDDLSEGALTFDPESVALRPGFTGFDFSDFVSYDFTVATTLLVPVLQPPSFATSDVRVRGSFLTFVATGLGADLATNLATSNAYAPSVVNEPGSVVNEPGFVITWEAGLEVYDLTAPNGDVYTMVRFNVASLLGRAPAFAFAPPGEFLRTQVSFNFINPAAAGWTYTARTLTEALSINRDIISIVTDDIGSIYVQVDAPVPPPAPLCEDGIVSSTGSVCCASSCGACGGCACSALPGGAAACCPNAILEDDIACVLSDDVGCVLDASIPRPVGTGTGCSD